MLSRKHREEIDGEPFGPGLFQESIWLRIRAGELSQQHMWSIINTLKAKAMELEGRCIKVSPKLEGRCIEVSPKLDRRGPEESTVQPRDQGDGGVAAGGRLRVR